MEAITKLEPDIIVKGGDYTVKTVVGNELAEVVIFPTVEGHSTTRIIDENIDNRSQRVYRTKYYVYLETKHEVAGYDFHPENLHLVKDYDWVIHQVPKF